MTYTEKEAETKWCPFTRVRNSGAVGVASVNRSLDGGNYAQCNCIASGCMSWRLAPQEYDEFYTLNGIRVPPGSPVSFEEAGKMRREEVPLPRKGFCGLAGQPNG